jgi:putative transposase
MVTHPSEYPWSSYRRNALGKPVKLLTPHPDYLALGNTDQERRVAYQALFRSQIPDLSLDEIRTAADKGWVLGDKRFKKQIEQQLGHKLPPFDRGGDRKSASFKTNNKIKLL